jgi:hypothetical protein
VAHGTTRVETRGVVRRLRAGHSQLADATLTDSMSFIYGGSKRITTRTNMVLNRAIDLADHHSQLANNTRLKDLAPPSALPRPKPKN